MREGRFRHLFGVARVALFLFCGALLAQRPDVSENPYPSNAYVDRHLHPAGKEGVVLVYWKARCEGYSFGCNLTKDFESGSDAIFWAKVNLRTDDQGSALWLHEGSQYFVVSWTWGAAVRTNKYGAVVHEKVYSYGKYSWSDVSILPVYAYTIG